MSWRIWSLHRLTMCASIATYPVLRLSHGFYVIRICWWLMNRVFSCCRRSRTLWLLRTTSAVWYRTPSGLIPSRVQDEIVDKNGDEIADDVLTMVHFGFIQYWYISTILMKYNIWHFPLYVWSLHDFIYAFGVFYAQGLFFYFVFIVWEMLERLHGGIERGWGTAGWLRCC